MNTYQLGRLMCVIDRDVLEITNNQRSALHVSPSSYRTILTRHLQKAASNPVVAGMIAEWDGGGPVERKGDMMLGYYHQQSAMDLVVPAQNDMIEGYRAE